VPECNKKTLIAMKGAKSDPKSKMGELQAGQGALSALRGMQREFALAAAIRLVVIAYAVWHDSHLLVKYTDVDYRVFSDAARFVSLGESPYKRATYRYTPLLAIILVPNEFLHPAFGKVLFAAGDICIGVLLARILHARPGVSASRAKTLVCLWLFNPIGINVSTRGNAEALVSLLVLAALSAVQEGRVVAGGAWLGLATHCKIYPIIYSLPLFLSIPSDAQAGAGVVRRFFAARRLLLALSASLAFLASTLFFFIIYGHEFLQEAYLYHVTRADARHNFSLYFYELYLHQDKTAVVTGLLAFLPQVLLLLALAWRFGTHDKVAACMCCQTVIFVALNKVYTVQYFVWYMALLPLALSSGPRIASPTGAAAIALGILGGMGAWLGTAYRLEFLGEPVWMELLAASCVLLLAHLALFASLVLRNA